MHFRGDLLGVRNEGEKKNYMLKMGRIAVFAKNTFFTLKEVHSSCKQEGGKMLKRIGELIMSKCYSSRIMMLMHS